MEARSAVLEQIARTTSSALERIERRLDSMDLRIDAVVTDQRADFRWLLGIMLGGFGAMLGVMAQGFHSIGCRPVPPIAPRSKSC
jgi:hypothetical protein